MLRAIALAYGVSGSNDPIEIAESAAAKILSSGGSGAHAVTVATETALKAGATDSQAAQVVSALTFREREKNKMFLSLSCGQFLFVFLISNFDSFLCFFLPTLTGERNIF
jgi:hypothetical protein